jgi:4-amino-4-deoxy-L-arabinose transferase-like glycosyltransferase
VTLWYHPLPAALIVAAMVLLSAAWMRGAEYDEQYTLFVTSGVARPAWPAHPFAAREVQRLQAGHADFATIAHDLRTTDVHPPLYFWILDSWRAAFGASLFVARMASVVFSLAALGMVALIARRVGIPAATATLLAVGSYGFVYTGTIARGFALANLLTLTGVAILLCAEQRGSGRLALAAGVLLGAATFSNYLAAFVGVACLLWLIARPGHLWRCASIGLAVWLPVDLWFFLAQRQSREGQFATFDAMSATMRLARYGAANVVGGLPLYVGGPGGQMVAVALALLLLALAGLTIWRWREIGNSTARWLLIMAAVAPPVGLLVLGVTFRSTPIELRYLAFAVPFIALLLAGGVASLPRRPRHVVCGLLLAVQALSLGGLMTRQETMQPARATAIAAAALAGDGVVLLPRGNDGVGIVGAFAVEAAPMLPLMIVGKDETADEVRARVGGFRRVVLALVKQDDDSRATLPVMRQAFADPCWRAAGDGFNVIAFESVCAVE